MEKKTEESSCFILDGKISNSHRKVYVNNLNMNLDRRQTKLGAREDRPVPWTHQVGIVTSGCSGPVHIKQERGLHLLSCACNHG
jgi:hypothetical protein